MLAHFPTLLPDELLYSGIARYHLMSGHYTQKQTIHSLFFEDRMVCSTVDLPSHISYLSKQLNNIYTVEQLIFSHTLFPFYSTFLTVEKAQHIFSLMSEGSPWGEVHISLGLAACSVKRPKYLKYCMGCITEDIACYNEPFWHRSHQLPGVYFCPIHKVELTESTIYSPTRNHKFEYVPLVRIETQGSNLAVNPNWKSHLLLIAEYSSELLVKENGYSDFTKNYKAYLVEKGYITIRGRIRFKQLISDFYDFFSNGLLEYLNCEINLKSDDTWFHKVIRGTKGGIHPLRHILLHIFLEIKIIEKQTKEMDFPFGEGPWPCLNKAAEHFMNNTINECKVTRDFKSGLPVGTFKCSCGFKYSRKGPDMSTEDRYRIGRIKCFGDVWMKKLNEVNQQDLSLRSKAKLLGVDPMTVKRYTGQKKVISKEQESQENQDEKEHRRERFLISLKEAEEKKKSVRQLNSKDYMWLYRLDRKWLEEIMHQREKIQKSGSIVVDWPERDKAVLDEVKKSYKFLVDEKKPKRITISELSRCMTGSLGDFLHNCLNKLPQTKEYLELVLESTEQFQIRRLEWAAERLEKETINIQGWQLLKLAGLNKPLKPQVELKYKEIIKYYV